MSLNRMLKESHFLPVCSQKEKKMWQSWLFLSYSVCISSVYLIFLLENSPLLMVLF